MPLVYYVPEYERDAEQIPLDAERLLRLLGVTGKLSGFRYAVYMVEQVRDQPDNVLLITKRLYKQTADHFNTTPSCVERNLRTLIQSCWNQLCRAVNPQTIGSSISLVAYAFSAQSARAPARYS